MLTAVVLGRERLTWARTLGVLLTMRGGGLAIGENVVEPGVAEHGWTGELAIFAAALCGAVCAVLYRPYLDRYPALPVSALAMLASVVALAVLAGVAESFFSRWPRFTLAGWLAVLFIGVSSGIGYCLWLWALGHAAPTRVAVFLSLSPVTAILFGAAILGEGVSAPSIAGLVCVITGLWSANIESQPSRPTIAYYFSPQDARTIP